MVNFKLLFFISFFSFLPVAVFASCPFTFKNTSKTNAIAVWINPSHMNPGGYHTIQPGGQLQAAVGDGSTGCFNVQGVGKVGSKKLFCSANGTVETDAMGDNVISFNLGGCGSTKRTGCNYVSMPSGDGWSCSGGTTVTVNPTY